MANKVLCTINLDSDVKLKAHTLGINISQATENLLKTMIARMNTIDLLEVVSNEKNLSTENDTGCYHNENWKKYFGQEIRRSISTKETR